MFDQEEQLPSGLKGWKTLDTITAYFADEPTLFEHFAVRLVELMDPKFQFSVADLAGMEGWMLSAVTPSVW